MMNWTKSMLALACALLPGCASMDPAAQTGHYEARVETPMFRYGPAQSFGPDFTLKQGQHVVLMGQNKGYSRIMTDEGQTGYAATEDLVPSAKSKTATADSASPETGNSTNKISRAPSYGPKSVYVRGHYRKDGSYVHPHTRSRPRR